MSIKSAFESEGIDFSQVMNPPEPWDGRALIKNVNGKDYACCPFCQKKSLRIESNTIIKHLRIKCKGSNCKKVYEVKTIVLKIVILRKIIIKNTNTPISKQNFLLKEKSGKIYLSFRIIKLVILED